MPKSLNNILARGFENRAKIKPVANATDIIPVRASKAATTLAQKPEGLTAPYPTVVKL